MRRSLNDFSDHDFTSLSEVFEAAGLADIEIASVEDSEQMF